jgi:PAS domain S-box-containing protein
MINGKDQKILILGSDGQTAAAQQQRLEAAGYAVLSAATADEALQRLKQNAVGLILLDPRGDLNGLGFCARLQAEGHDVPVVLANGARHDVTVIKSLKARVGDRGATSTNGLDHLPAAIDHVLQERRAESQLAESEAHLAAIIHSAKDAIIIVGPDRRITLFNPAAEQMFRCPAGTALGQPLSRFIPKEFVTASADRIDGPTPASISLTELIRAGSRGIRADGEEFPLEASFSRAEVGRRRFHTVVVRDITQRRLAEEALCRSEMQFHQIWDKSRDGMRLTDAKGAIRLVNDAFCKLVGKPRDALEGQPLSTIYARHSKVQILEEYRQRFASRTIEPHLTTEIALWDGKKVHFELSNSFLELPGERPLLLSVIRDITGRISLEEQLRQSQKMEAVGRLAGGVAHDFNNMLTVITGHCEILLSRFASTEPLRESIREVRKAGERAASLTRQLLAFSRKQLLAPQVVDLNVLITEMEKMLRRLIGEDIDFATVLDANLGTVRVDPGQIEQVLMNLVVNARDAMPKGGHLTIETRNVELDEHYAKERPEVQSGSYAMIAVTDTGTGMDAEIKTRIFEPFFTTKEVGRGTGLGLSTALGIVKQSGGHIEVYSELSRGTTFKVYIPRTEGAVAPSKTFPNLLGASKGTETILLAEDDDSVRSLVSLSLRSYGYTVLEAQDGDEALKVCQQHDSAIDLLVTDVVMPRLSGRELAALLMPLRPKMKVLFLSGYTDEAISRHGILEAGVPFLQKPFTPGILARKVREALGIGPAAGTQ